MAPSQALNATGEARILPHKAEDLLSGALQTLKALCSWSPASAPSGRFSLFPPCLCLFPPRGDVGKLPDLGPSQPCR